MISPAGLPLFSELTSSKTTKAFPLPCNQFWILSTSPLTSLTSRQICLNLEINPYKAVIIYLFRTADIRVPTVRVTPDVYKCDIWRLISDPVGDWLLSGSSGIVETNV